MLLLCMRLILQIYLELYRISLFGAEPEDKLRKDGSGDNGGWASIEVLEEMLEVGELCPDDP